MGKEWVEELELRKAKIMEQVMEMELVEEQAEELEQHMASDKEFRAAREQVEHKELVVVEVEKFMGLAMARYLFNMVVLS